MENLNRKFLFWYGIAWGATGIVSAIKGSEVIAAAFLVSCAIFITGSVKD